VDELTLDEVNAAIKRHLQYRDLKIAMVTGDAAGLRARLESDAPTPIAYATPKSDAIMAEDLEIAAWPLALGAERIEIVPVADAFALAVAGPRIQPQLFATREQR
jgi:zinc protease